jgi:hypothetical protein
VRRDSYGLEVPACECGAFKPEGMFDALIRIQAAAKAGDIDIADVNKRLVGELREVLST